LIYSLNKNFQNPNPNFQTNSKYQFSKLKWFLYLFGIRCLKFEIYLILDACNLEFDSQMKYQNAGVHIDTADKALKGMKDTIVSTFQKSVLGGFGGFGGLFELKDFDNPVLVSSVDGVGTKLKIAFLMNRHDTVGQDIVNHCINDILTIGAKPLFFLDYISAGQLDSEVIQEVLKGISKACKEQKCSLIGGETAEMPGFYQNGEYELVGFILGGVEKEEMIDTSAIREGDQVIGLPSTGLHTNGYSLARRILFDAMGLTVNDRIDDLEGTIGEELLKIHRCFAPEILALLKSPSGKDVKGMAHITGGGLIDNIPRILPEGCGVVINRNAWEPQPIFSILREAGDVPIDEMFRTFNMGIGLVIIVNSKGVDSLMSQMESENPVVLGDVVSGARRVHLTD
jgi:phosphoribosylformylglycinamidine cyclo-ligase